MSIKKTQIIKNISKLIISIFILSSLTLFGCGQVFNLLNPPRTTNQPNQDIKLGTSGDIIKNDPSTPENYILSLTYGLFGDEIFDYSTHSLFLDNAASGPGSQK